MKLLVHPAEFVRHTGRVGRAIVPHTAHDAVGGFVFVNPIDVARMSCHDTCFSPVVLLGYEPADTDT